MSNGILVFIEHKGGAANKSSFEAIAAAQALGKELQQKVSLVVLGADVSAFGPGACSLRCREGDLRDESEARGLHAGCLRRRI